MFNPETTDYIEKLIREKRQGEEKPDHFDMDIQGEGKSHFQIVDSELNRDAIIFTTALARIAGLNTVVYHKFTADGELFVYSDYFNPGKDWFSGDGLIGSYDIDEIKNEFLSKAPVHGYEMFKKYCSMIILDIFTLNCDRTHNNWLYNGKDILSYDYNFTFGSAQLLHGVSNDKLIRLLSTGITDSFEGCKNEFLNDSFRKKGKLGTDDLIQYTMQKSCKLSPAHTRFAEHGVEVGLLDSFRGLIHYFNTQNSGTELINFYLNLTADRVFESIPEESKITLQGNKRYLESLFENVKCIIKN